MVTVFDKVQILELTEYFGYLILFFAYVTTVRFGLPRSTELEHCQGSDLRKRTRC